MVRSRGLCMSISWGKSRLARCWDARKGTLDLRDQSSRAIRKGGQLMLVSTDGGEIMLSLLRDMLRVTWKCHRNGAWSERIVMERVNPTSEQPKFSWLCKWGLVGAPPGGKSTKRVDRRIPIVKWLHLYVPAWQRDEHTGTKPGLQPFHVPFYYTYRARWGDGGAL